MNRRKSKKMLKYARNTIKEIEKREKKIYKLFNGKIFSMKIVH